MWLRSPLGLLYFWRLSPEPTEIRDDGGRGWGQRGGADGGVDKCTASVSWIKEEESGDADGSERGTTRSGGGRRRRGRNGKREKGKGEGGEQRVY